MAAVPPSLRDRKKRQTHELLQAIALELFDARGFDDVTVDEIAECADVSRSTFFRYFPTKEDVLVGRATERLEELRAAFAGREADEPVLRTLRWALQALADGYEHRRHEFVVLRRIAEQHPGVRARALEHQSVLEGAFATLLAERLGGADPTGLRARVTAGAVMAAVRVAVDEWIEEGGDLRPLLDATFDVLDEGLGSSLGDR